MVGVNGLEPLISRLSAECSNQLSYTPNICIVTVYARTCRFLHPIRGRAWSVSFGADVNVAVSQFEAFKKNFTTMGAEDGFEPPTFAL